MRIRSALLGTVTVLTTGLLLLVACGTQAKLAAPPAKAGPSPTPSQVDGCVQPGEGRIVTLAEDPVTVLPGLLLGSGTRGVVLTPEHGGSICQWLPFGRSLATQGYHVLAWDPGADPLHEIPFFVDALRKDGATRVVLVGASNGANICTFAAADLRPPVDGLGWLSGEDQMFVLGLPGQPVEPAARRLTVPVLFIAGRDDLYRSADAAALFARLAPSKQKKVLTVPGDEHGVEMLSGPYKSTVVPALMEFLHAHTA
jgi:pimeloyl-ACP methyl ester carboxylesterase